MAENDNKGLTAEQQLLALIEGADKKPEPVAPAAPAAKSEPVMQPVRMQASHGAGVLSIAKRQAPAFSADVLKGRLAFLQDSLAKLFKSGDMSLGLSFVNNTLIFFIAILFIFMAYDIFFKQKEMKTLPQLLEMKKEVSQPVGLSAGPTKDVVFYTEKVKNRDIFKPAEKKAEEKETVKEVPRSLIDENIKDLRLVGLSPASDTSGSFVMMENMKSKSTSFLKEGDVVSGLTVKKILPDKVILTDGALERELR